MSGQEKHKEFVLVCFGPAVCGGGQTPVLVPSYTYCHLAPQGRVFSSGTCHCHSSQATRQDIIITMEATPAPPPKESDAVPLPGENGYSTENFRIGISEIEGLGMFAVRDLPKGTCILRESNEVEPAEVLKKLVVERNIQSVDETKASATSEVSICGPNIARVNHSCSRWNSAYANVTANARELHAVSLIRKGAEITQCYSTQPVLHFTQPGGGLENRATNNVNRCRVSMLLKKQFGFLCSCTDCITERLCIVCQKTMGLKKCAQCGVVWYCSRACQKSDWKEHKSECQTWSPAKKDLEAKAKSRLSSTS